VGVVAVQVGKHDDVCAGGVPGRGLASDSTEMADTGGQDGVEQEGCAAILPGDGAVPPPCHRAAHGVPAPRDPGTAPVPSMFAATIVATRLHMSAISVLAIGGADLPRFCIFDSIGSVDRRSGPAGQRDEKLVCSSSPRRASPDTNSAD
jgi:hypothetical protein